MRSAARERNLIPSWAHRPRCNRRPAQPLTLRRSRDSSPKDQARYSANSSQARKRGLLWNGGSRPINRPASTAEMSCASALPPAFSARPVDCWVLGGLLARIREGIRRTRPVEAPPGEAMTHKELCSALSAWVAFSMGGFRAGWRRQAAWLEWCFSSMLRPTSQPATYSSWANCSFCSGWWWRASR